MTTSISPARFINIIAAGMLVLSALLLSNTFWGYGTLKVVVPDNRALSVTLNGKPFGISGQPQKVRPGNYTLTIRSPRFTTYQRTVNVRTFKQTAVTPVLQARDTDSVLTSAIGAVGYYGAPVLSDPRWFGDEWLVGAATTPSVRYPVALRYQKDGSWKVAYYKSVAGYPNDASALNQDVASYVTELEGKYGSQ